VLSSIDPLVTELVMLGLWNLLPQIEELKTVLRWNVETLARLSILLKQVKRSSFFLKVKIKSGIIKTAGERT
jgi:hypothetical protein